MCFGKPDKYAPARRIRSKRLREARKRGTHTKQEWAALKSEFDNRCVRCGKGGCPLDKDHIIPLYRGGSDGLDNIQPLCSSCNYGKGPETKNWVKYRRSFGWGD